LLNIVRSMHQFLGGLQKIEREIIERTRAAGIYLRPQNLQWQRGQGLMPPPAAIAVQIRVQGKTANTTFSRDQVENSWERVARPDVCARVQEIIERLTS